MSRLFIYAPNIHKGGGAVLLKSLINSAPKKYDLYLCCDSRFDIKGKNIKVVRPTLFSRLLADFWLYKNVTNDDLVLFFGNLPPFLKAKGLSYLFIQNRYLLKPYPSIYKFNFLSALRLFIERILIRIFSFNVDYYIVQTESMKQRLLDTQLSKKPVLVVPFAPIPLEQSLSEDKYETYKEGGSDYSFIYPASGEPHKNHIILLKAWGLLSTSNLKPTLILTLDKKTNHQLLTEINEIVERFKLNVINLGVLDKKKLNKYYKETSALIFPSLVESFGLPIIEAKVIGLPIIASELDYVRDIVTPDESFNPNSEVSIARAVKRFMGLRENSWNRILSSKLFIRYLFNNTNLHKKNKA